MWHKTPLKDEDDYIYCGGQKQISQFLFQMQKIQVGLMRLTSHFVSALWRLHIWIDSKQ